MTERPRDPTTDDTDARPDRTPTNGVSRWQKMVGAAGLVAVLWAGNALYDTASASGGGGPGGDHGPGGPPPGVDHGPGGDAPVEQQEPDSDTDDGGDGHDPSDWEH
jgi:hypothetical protein